MGPNSANLKVCLTWEIHVDLIFFFFMLLTNYLKSGPRDFDWLLHSCSGFSSSLFWGSRGWGNFSDARFSLFC